MPSARLLLSFATAFYFLISVFESEAAAADKGMKDQCKAVTRKVGVKRLEFIFTRNFLGIRLPEDDPREIFTFHENPEDPMLALMKIWPANWNKRAPFDQPEIETIFWDATERVEGPAMPVLAPAGGMSAVAVTGEPVVQLYVEGRAAQEIRYEFLDPRREKKKAGPSYNPETMKLVEEGVAKGFLELARHQPEEMPERRRADIPLKLSFSPDSRFLLAWNSEGVEVKEVQSRERRTVLRVPNPWHDIETADWVNGQVVVIRRDGTVAWFSTENEFLRRDNLPMISPNQEEVISETLFAAAIGYWNQQPVVLMGSSGQLGVRVLDAETLDSISTIFSEYSDFPQSIRTARDGRIMIGFGVASTRLPTNFHVYSQLRTELAAGHPHP